MRTSSIVATSLLSSFFTIANPTFAAATDKLPADSSTTENQSSTITSQLEVSSNLNTVNKDFNMDENGVIGLTDNAGTSISSKYYLDLAKKYEEQLKEDRQNISLRLKLAKTWEALKKDDNALEAYSQILEYDNNNMAAQQGIERLQRERQLQLRVYWSSAREKEYSPLLQARYASWQEQVHQVQVTKSWGGGKAIGFGWLESSIEQENLTYGDIDYALHRQAPFFMFSWLFTDRISTSFRIRDEKFSNDNSTSFYQLQEDKHIITGHFLANYKGDGFWATVNYSRNRDTDPIYDSANDRALLYLEIKELTGISAGIPLSPRVEIGSSIYYEQYKSTNLNQFNPNIQVSYWPQWLPGIQMSLGSGYYTEEKETIINMATRYQWQPLQQLKIQLEYQLEYSENEASLLNQGDLLFNWLINKQLSLTLRSQYGAETGDDRDTAFFTQISLNWDLF